jgi:Carboxypeptidase regulatory-like domain
VRAAVAFLLPVWLATASIAASPAPQSSSSSSSRVHDFLIFTTVFTDQGFTLYGAHTRVRRAEEKKYRWEAISDHSGEFAIRVPQGAQYEMTIEAKGFKTQTLKVDATQDVRADLTVHMEPLSGSAAAPHADPPAGGKP